MSVPATSDDDAAELAEDIPDAEAQDESVAEDASAEPAPEADGGAVGPRSRWRMSPPRLALLLGLTMAVALAAVIGFLGVQAHRAQQAADLRALYLQVGRQGAVNLTTIDWHHADADVQRAVPLRPAVELSKMYVLPDAHGAGVSAALMTATLDLAIDGNAACVWLGVNQKNQRAQRFYAKHGFEVGGTKTFQLGDAIEHDYVMVRPLSQR